MRAIFAVVLVAIAVGPARLTVAGGAPATANDVLRRVEATYAACRTYRDEGVVTESYGSSEKMKPFTTAFRRPQQLRFEFSDGERRHTVISDGTVVEKRSPGRPVETMAALGLALGAVHGVSGGSALGVPRLLLESGDPRRMTNIRDARLAAAEAVGGVRCLGRRGR